MEAWTEDECRTIAAADDLYVSPFREDGMTYGTPTWIWSVIVDGHLYARAYNGHASSWFKAALQQRKGRIATAGMTRDVTFEPVGEEINDRIDDAYRKKYATSSYLNPMVGKRASAATVRIRPRTS